MKELFEAFGKCLDEIQNPPKDRTANVGTFKYKYADLIDVVEEVKKVTRKHKIHVFQPITHKDGVNYVSTQLTHKGEVFEASLIALNPNNNPQKLGAEITYFRRYALTSLFGIVADDDIDANTQGSGRDSISVGSSPAMKEAQGNYQPSSRVVVTGSPIPSGQRPLSEAQIKRIFAISKSQGYSMDQVKEIMVNMTGKQSTHELTKPEYEKLCDYLQSHNVNDHLDKLVKNEFFNPDSEPLGFG